MRGMRPIIGFIPEDGEASKIIKTTRTGEYCSSADIDKMKSLMLKFYSRWESDKIAYDPDLKAISDYDRRMLTGELAHILNELA
jgi:hypothetical protein